MINLTFSEVQGNVLQGETANLSTSIIGSLKLIVTYELIFLYNIFKSNWST